MIDGWLIFLFVVYGFDYLLLLCSSRLVSACFTFPLISLAWRFFFYLLSGHSLSYL